MDMKYVQSRLEQEGLTKESNSFAGENFDLVYKKKILGGGIYLVMKHVSFLESGLVSEWEKKFKQMYKKAAGFFAGDPFIILIIADNANPVAAEKLTRTQKKMGNLMCVFYVVNKKLEIVHANIPKLIGAIAVKDIYEKVAMIFSDALYMAHDDS